jgi:YD repeat-containing protein
MRATTTFDAIGQIIGIRTDSSHSEFARATYAYDPVGNRTTLVDFNGSTSGYSYDAKNRLIEDNTTGPNAHDYTYTYDANGKRLTNSETGVVAFSTYDAANRLVTTVASGLTTTFAYWPEGTLSKVTEPTVTYTYGQDVEHRLAWQSANPGGIRTRVYDANGKMACYSGPPPAGVLTIVWDGDDYLQLRS